MDIWNPLIGEILKCKREPTNGSLDNESVVRHIPQNISKFSSMFFMIPFISIEVGLEIPVRYRFYGQEKIVQWLTKKM